jgi:hypothetical protein
MYKKGKKGERNMGWNTIGLFQREFLMEKQMLGSKNV